MDKRYIGVLVFLIALAVGGGIYLFSSKAQTENQLLATPTPFATIEGVMEDKLIIADEKVGTGAEAVSGKKITVNYVGTLTDGTKFDSSYDRSEPFTFNLGTGEVIAGWDQGFAGMKVGGKRKLTIPPSLGYGVNGAGGLIPPNATLIFEVELLKVE